MKVHSLSVLLIDAASDDVAVLSQRLAESKNNSFSVQTAPSWPRAIELLDGNHFDVVMLDTQTLASREKLVLKDLQARLPDTPVVLMSRTHDEAQALEAVRAGAQDYVVKSRLTAPALERILLYGIERQRARKSISMQYSVSRILRESKSVAEADVPLLRTLCEFVGGDLARLWRFDSRSNELVFVEAWSRSAAADPAAAVPANPRVSKGAGIAGRAWTAGGPVWFAEVPAEHIPPSLQNAASAHGALALPIIVGSGVLGAIELFSVRLPEPDDELLKVFSNIANQIGQFKARKFAEEQKDRMEVELRLAQKLEAVGALAAGIAHEINTPIQFIGDNTRFLQDAFRDGMQLLHKYDQICRVARTGPVKAALLDDVQALQKQVDWDYLQAEIPKALEQMLEGVSRVATIVRAMKEFSHVDRSAQKVAADLNKALESTLVVARNELKYVADVETALGELPQVLCHLGDLNQVFLNLLINAAHAIGDVVKGTQHKGRILIRTRCDAEFVEIAIHDTGTGIPKEIRDKIFDPFFTTKEVGKGSGQGLALAHAIVVEKHGGTLTFETEVGKGTTFYVRLPVGPVNSIQEVVTA